jgi:hypothetical protein
MARLRAADDFAAIRSRMEELQRERERAVRRKAFEVYHRSPSLEPAGEQAQPRRPFPERTCILRE